MKNDKALGEILNSLGNERGNALKVLEIGSGNGQRAEFLATNFPEWTVIATDFSTDRPKDASKAFYLQQDVHDLVFRDDYFDIVFSVAVSEHYKNTPLALEEQYRVIRPGGLFYFVHTPFFSCSKGHHAHYRPIRELFPPYGHLYLDEDEFVASCLQRRNAFGLIDAYSEKDIVNIVRGIYNREDLSRVYYQRFKEMFDHTAFQVIQWKILADPEFDSENAEKVLPLIPSMSSLEEMKIEKLRCVARKPK